MKKNENKIKKALTDEIFVPGFCACCAPIQECFPTSPSANILPAFKASFLVLLAVPNSCLPLQFPPGGLDSEALVSVCCSQEQGCEFLLVAQMEVSAYSPAPPLQSPWADGSLTPYPARAPSPQLPSVCLGCPWLLTPGSDPQFLASQSHSVWDLCFSLL